MAIGTVFTLTGREVSDSQLFHSIEKATSKSAKCKEIWDKIKANRMRVDFVIFSQGTNAEALFDEEETGVTALGFNPREKYLELLNRNRPGHATGPGFDRMPNPVVYWSPDCKYPVFTNIQPAGVLIWSPNAYTIAPQPSIYMRKTEPGRLPPRTVERPLIWATKVDLPAEIVLFHELGHVLQYMTDRNQFVNWLNSHDINALEADNLERHEAPICRDYGLGTRSNYHEDVTFLSSLPQTTYFRCATATQRRALDDLIATNSANAQFRGRPVRMANYFENYRLGNNP